MFAQPFETLARGEVNPIPDYEPDSDFDDSLIGLDGYNAEDDPEKVPLQIIDPDTREPRVAYVSEKYDSRHFTEYLIQKA